MSNFYYKKQYSKKTPLLICCMAIMVPIGVFYHKSLQMKVNKKNKKNMSIIFHF